MNQLEQQLLKAELGDVTPRISICSKTQVDTGRWWRHTPLWLCLVDSEVVTLAIARRRYLQRVPLAECCDSHYCHATGELIIAPAEELTFNRFAMSPKQALDFLRAVGLYEPDLPTTAPAAKAPIKEPAPVAKKVDEAAPAVTAPAVIDMPKKAPAPKVEASPKEASPKVEIANEQQEPSPAKSGDNDEVAALLASDELKALLSDEEREELAHLSADEIRALLEELDQVDDSDEPDESDDDTGSVEAVSEEKKTESDEVAALLASDELKDLLSEEERKELAHLSVEEIQELLANVDEADEEIEDEASTPDEPDDRDEVAALLESDELKALLSDEERQELNHLSAAEIREMLDAIAGVEDDEELSDGKDSAKS